MVRKFLQYGCLCLCPAVGAVLLRGDDVSSDVNFDQDAEGDQVLKDVETADKDVEGDLTPETVQIHEKLNL